MNKFQSIFQKHGALFKENHLLHPNQQKAMDSISSCRTNALGGHADKCADCGHTQVFYNSCRNRHCPNCQSLKRFSWVEERLSDALPVPYFHTVFTVPQELNPLFLAFPELFLGMLFKAASKTVLELAASKKFINAQVGMIATLHTWGQNLQYHPHIHMIIPGVGLSRSGIEIRSVSKKFFLPVKTLSRIFRAKLLEAIKIAFQAGQFTWHDPIKLQDLIDSLFKKKWVVYCKRPFKSTWHLLQYLGAYTHKTAISNSRIINVEGEQVTFKWRDYRDKMQKQMVLPVHEFIRRFLMHVVPTGLMRIRHYGILSNANRNRKLLIVKRLLGVKIYKYPKSNSRELLLKLKGIDIQKCPLCAGAMQTCQTFWPVKRE